MRNTTPAIHLTVDDTFQNARYIGASLALIRFLRNGLENRKMNGMPRSYTRAEMCEFAVELQENLKRVKV